MEQYKVYNNIEVQENVKIKEKTSSECNMCLLLEVESLNNNCHDIVNFKCNDFKLWSKKEKLSFYFVAL